MTSSDVQSTYGVPAFGSVSAVKGAPAVSRTAVMDTFMVKKSVTTSEIIWALKVIINHLSFRSCSDLNETLRVIFPDSSIAQNFLCLLQKVAYTIVHGLASYFCEQLLTEVQDSQFFVTCFDEALNKVAQKGQMDIVIRFWDDTANQMT